jgi:hypothetical protein
MMIKLFRNILVIACLGIFSVASAEMQYKGVIYPKDATNGYFMYYTTAGGLVNSPLSSDGVNVTNSGTLTSGAITGPSLTNAAALTLSSSGAGVNVTTHSDAGDDFTVNTTALVVEGDTGNVGIGTASPDGKLHIHKAENIVIRGPNAGSGGAGNTVTLNIVPAYDTWASTSESGTRIVSKQIDSTSPWGTELQFWTYNLGINQRMVIDKSGNVGIGTASPSQPLHIANGVADAYSMRMSNIANTSYWDSGLDNVTSGGYRFAYGGSEKIRFPTGGGLTFNGDTAAANALDDYEEGTWTPTFTTSGTAISSVTYSTTTGARYVKIGGLVHVQGFIQATAVTLGSASGIVKISGLPFTVSSYVDGDYNAQSTASMSESSGFSTHIPSVGQFAPESTNISLKYRTTIDSHPGALDFSYLASGSYIWFSGNYISD